MRVWNLIVHHEIFAMNMYLIMNHIVIPVHVARIEPLHMNMGRGCDDATAFSHRVLPEQSEATNMSMSMSMCPPRSDEATAFSHRVLPEQSEAAPSRTRTARPPA